MHALHFQTELRQVPTGKQLIICYAVMLRGALGALRLIPERVSSQ